VTTKSAFPALGKPLSLAIVHGTFHIKGLALPKFVERGNFSLNNLVIRLLSLKMDHQTEAGQPKCRPTNVRGAVNGLGYRNTLSCSLHTAR
jgi:hypothetical protein